MGTPRKDIVGNLPMVAYAVALGLLGSASFGSLYFGVRRLSPLSGL